MAHGKLQLAKPMSSVKEMSKLSLMVTYCCSRVFVVECLDVKMCTDKLKKGKKLNQ